MEIIKFFKKNIPLLAPPANNFCKIEWENNTHGGILDEYYTVKFDTLYTKEDAVLLQNYINNFLRKKGLGR